VLDGARRVAVLLSVCHVDLFVECVTRRHEVDVSLDTARLDAPLLALQRAAVPGSLRASDRADVERVAHSARFLFLDPAAGEFYIDWDRVADELVAHLRSDAGRNPYDRGLSDLVGELSTRSSEFRTRWAAHNVRFHQTGTKRLHHPLVGDLELSYEALELPADNGITINVYTAEAGSRSQEALLLLGSWAATSDHAGIARSANEA